MMLEIAMVSGNAPTDACPASDIKHVLYIVWYRRAEQLAVERQPKCVVLKVKPVHLRLRASCQP